MATHEQAWAEGLAQEQAHQQELLATFRGELGAFARELAASLTALDACVGGMGEIAQAVGTARTAHSHATLVVDCTRRLGKLAPSSADAELHERLAEGDVPPGLVDHARTTLQQEPTRTDRELLQAVVTAAGARAQIEELIGPAPVAALTALVPLVRRIPRLASSQQGEVEHARTSLTEVLIAAGQTGSAADLPELAAAANLAQSLREAADHAQAAAEKVERGKIDQVIAEARKVLEADLEQLRGVLKDAADDAPTEWLEQRAGEHEALTDEVREKLERLERFRGWLLMLLPRVQLVARALGTVQRVRMAERQLWGHQTVVAEAARQLVIADLATLWDGPLRAFGKPRKRSSSRRTWVLAAVVLAALAAGGTALALAMGGGKDTAAASTPATTNKISVTLRSTVATPTVPSPKVSAIRATFVEAEKTTFYRVAVRTPEKVTYSWGLAAPKNDPGCNNFEVLKPGLAAWHHGGDQGCSHIGLQHEGTVSVVITTPHWSCRASFFGTLTRTGALPELCVAGG